MEQLTNTILANFNLFILILIRVTGIFVAAPVFARNNFPMLLKVGLSATISFILLPTLGEGYMLEINGFLQLGYYSMMEFLIGLLIGFISFTYFTVIYVAGTIIDVQMGFSMVNVFDPQTNTQVPIMGNFYNNIISLLFIVMNGHHLLIRALVGSYRLLPVGFTFTIGDNVVVQMTMIFSEIFILAVKFSAPVLITVILVDILLGVLARTMPQMNVFVVGMPLKIVVGMVMILITLPFVIPFSEILFNRMFESVFDILKILSKG
ncbi:flagellar biosynthetic protein FliR [Alkaliphilus hydrothermalis]|uniref:Flagellar biosynthetic protein FliR n=1 Tax=Alkaliphilus hydrothermalis TaxID=1482730 RepID=A0ABS2NM66_9FIRM|nr:flagellar biosynthetic protein FliR [Alkaliphilus hydrothermalis]MBM7613674.1 flagellar biosynthetic protein FliR [Alkaliphilus hydrothermalis]